jgi:hypothetical protein
MMEAAIELRTRQYIPEDSELHTRRRENLKSYKTTVVYTKTQTKKVKCSGSNVKEQNKIAVGLSQNFVIIRA